MAIYCAIFGTGLIFVGGYLVEKARGVSWLRTLLHLAAMLPLAVPGLVLGIAIFSSSTTRTTPSAFSTAPWASW